MLWKHVHCNKLQYLQNGNGMPINYIFWYYEEKCIGFIQKYTGCAIKKYIFNFSHFCVVHLFLLKCSTDNTEKTMKLLYKNFFFILVVITVDGYQYKWKHCTNLWVIIKYISMISKPQEIFCKTMWIHELILPQQSYQRNI